MRGLGSSHEMRDAAGVAWTALLTHGFPVALADATLPPERFRFYVSQNLLYLPEYARVIAFAAARSADGAELAEHTESLVNIVATELPQNRRLLDAISQLAPTAMPGEGVKAPATLAYTSWLLSTAATGTSLDIAAAILPCAWSYGEIARGLVGGAAEHPVYTEWLRFFASDEYDAVVVRQRAAFDAALATQDDDARARLADIFLMGCRLERSFWDQGLAMQHWDDVAA
ncbi:thiaminase II [Demequina capsici]|uniref:Aminopyrimidine aminohydrolase n=1 Tax=Demequina capsici TaxID=3075620 RepID=A0AA96J7I7_9MICO|nr:thiaminase II [Demequina sp. OYTSA14]WNM24073.1 thiaminase II [Demequina sp. OYTSA14]